MAKSGSGDAVRVFVASVDDHDAERLRHLEQAVLLPDERRRAREMLHAPGRRAYILAHALQRLVLRELLGYAPVFAAGPNGKPELACRSLHTNLSHSAKHVALAVSPDAAVGVDIESLPPKVDIHQVMSASLTPHERERVRAESNPPLSFLIHWTAKEAYVKATAEGLSRSFSSLSLATSDLPLHLEGPDVVRHVLHCSAFPDHVVAVCALGDSRAGCCIEHALCDIHGLTTRMFLS